MEQELLSRRTENTLMITVEFLEDGYVLKSGRSKLHSYRLDLLVRNDITLDQLLGAVYAGIRRVLVEQYHLDLSKNWASVVYQDLRDPFAMRAADDRRGKRRLRPRIVRSATLRIAAMRYQGQRRRFREMEDRYPMLPDQSLSLSPEKKERMGWIVCWQVFHECYRAYLRGYPDNGGNPPQERVRTEEYLCHPVIARGGVDLSLDENGTYHGGTNRPQLQLIRSRDGGKTLRDLGFVNSSRLIFDPVLWHHSAALYDNRAMDPTVGHLLPFYKIGDRLVPDVDHTQYRILQPRDPVPVPRMDPIPLLLPPILTTSAVVGTWALAGEMDQDHLAMVLCAMFGSTVGLGLLYHQLHRFQYHRALRRWVKPYQEYIRSALAEIRTRQDQDTALMKQMYPPVVLPGGKTDLVHQILEVSGEMFTRKPGDADFLKFRLGLSAEGSHLVPSRFPVTGELKNAELSAVRFKNLRSADPNAFELCTAMPRRGESVEDMPVELLPQAIAREFGYLYHAPVLLDLRHSSGLGVVFPDSRRSFLPFLSNLVLDLCFHHRPEDLQFVMLCPETTDWKDRQDIISRFKHLPHFGELLKDLSPFAFNRAQAWQIFNQLQKRLAQRSHLGKECPHIVVLALEEYDLREHGLRAYLPDSPEQANADQGISFVFCKHTEQALPPCCAQIIRAESRKEWFCLPANLTNPASRQLWGAYRFRPDLQLSAQPQPDYKADADRLYRAFKMLSALYHRKEDRSLVPSYVELFELHTEPSRTLHCFNSDPAGKQAHLETIYQQLQQTIRRRWSDRSSSLSFPVGRNESGIVWLDLEESGAGSHLFITGDRGTGKTMAAAGCLISMCARHAPEHLELIPVDHQGTGLQRMLGTLPHVQRQISATGATRSELRSRIHGLLCWLDEVCLERQRLLAAARVERIGQFNAAYPDRRMRHLVLAIDDYGMLAHLLRNAPTGEPEYDLDTRLMQLMQTAQGLGIHLVLISQPMEHSAGLELMDRIPARLCLKLSDPQMSRRILYTPAAANPVMPDRGRAYLVGDGGNVFSYLQLPDPEADVGGTGCAPFRVTLGAAGGSYRSFFDSRSYAPPASADVRTWSQAAAQKIPSDWQKASKTTAPSGGDQVPGSRTGDFSPENTSGDFTPERSSGDFVPGSGSGDFAPGAHPGTPRNRMTPKEAPAPEPEEDFRPGAGWESIRRAEYKSPWEQNPIPGDWRENFFRRWRGHDYQYEPPVPDEAQPEATPEWVRPDAALLPPVHFGVTQREFLVRLMQDMAGSPAMAPKKYSPLEV